MLSSFPFRQFKYQLNTVIMRFLAVSYNLKPIYLFLLLYLDVDIASITCNFFQTFRQHFRYCGKCKNRRRNNCLSFPKSLQISGYVQLFSFSCSCSVWWWNWCSSHLCVVQIRYNWCVLSYVRSVIVFLYMFFKLNLLTVFSVNAIANLITVSTRLVYTFLQWQFTYRSLFSYCFFRMMPLRWLREGSILSKNLIDLSISHSQQSGTDL